MRRKIYLFCIFLCSLTTPAVGKRRVSIVGAGIGGTSCAYFLSQLFHNDIEIDVYEKDIVGGRLATVKYGSDEYETGGSVIHSRNQYMTDFVEKFNLNKRTSRNEGKMGLYSGSGFNFITSDWMIVNVIKLFLRYGISMYKINQFISRMLDSFDKIYKLQSDGVAFKSVSELLENLNPDFLVYANISTYDALKKYGNLNDLIIEELVQASLYVNYGQTTKVQAFVGAVSLAGLLGSLWAVENGNKKVAEKCLSKSNANYYNSRVVKIIKQNDTFSVQSIDQNNNQKEKSYDFVVLAAPITSNAKDKINFVNFGKPVYIGGQYHRTVATILKGKLNKNQFCSENCDFLNSVDCIINLNLVDFNSIGIIHPVSGRCDSKNIWKIFSQKVLSTNDINKLFNVSEIVQVKDWLAYPDYKEYDREDSFVLSDNLYYINAIEWAASAMEMSVIGAKNVALLIQNSSSYKIDLVPMSSVKEEL